MSDDVLDYLRTRFNRLDERLDTIDRRLNELVTRISSLEYHFAARAELAAVNARLDNLDRRVARIERRPDLVEAPTPAGGAALSEISEDELDTMVNIVPDDSGLPTTVWVRPRSNERDGPRIKVCTIYGPRMSPRDTVSVTLPPTIRVIPPGGLPPADLSAVSDWIRLNEATITAFWESRISGVEFGRRLQKLPP